MAVMPPIDVNVVFIEESKLREIIREEIRRAVEPGAQRPPYLPAYPYPDGREWWQNPVISYAQDEGIVINA